MAENSEDRGLFCGCGGGSFIWIIIIIIAIIILFPLLFNPCGCKN